MIRNLEFIGRTKDGDYGRKVKVEQNEGERISYTAMKVITENGYVDIEVVLDEEGRLETVIVERTNIGL